MKILLIFVFAIGLILPSSTFALVEESELIKLANAERSNNGLASLEYNTTLQKAAQMKANDMAKRGYFSHRTPDGKTPWYFFDQVGYGYRYAGENLAVNFFDSKEIALAWMNSPTHRANILKKNFTQIGIGVAYGIFQGKNTVFVAEFFGTPALSAKTITKQKIKAKKTPQVLRRKIVAY